MGLLVQMYGLALAPLMLQLECFLQARRGSDAHTVGVGSDCFMSEGVSFIRVVCQLSPPTHTHMG